MIRVELELVLLLPGIVTGDSSQEIFFLGIVRGIPEEKVVANYVRTARFEKVSGVDIVSFQDPRRFLIVPRVVNRYAVAEEGYRKFPLRTIDFTDFSEIILLYSGLVSTLPRCSNDISLCESGDKKNHNNGNCEQKIENWPQLRTISPFVPSQK